jgi:hypothetical protein
MTILGYDIYWDGVSPGSGTFTKVSSTSTTSYENTDVTAGLVYQFKVLAFNVVGDGSLSSAVTIKAAQQPDAPAMPTLVSQGPNSITISWTAPDSQYDTITDYKVYWDFGNGGNWFV